MRTAAWIDHLRPSGATAAVDPLRTFKVNPMNGREAGESGLRLNASVVATPDRYAANKVLGWSQIDFWHHPMAFSQHTSRMSDIHRAR